MRLVLAVLITVWLSSVTFGQEQTDKSPQNRGAQPITKRQLDELPRQHNYRPKLSLQQALKIAEHFIKAQKMDLSSYYLFEAKWILYGGEANGDPRWYFWWLNNDGASGHYLQVTISMAGKPQILPSM